MSFIWSPSPSGLPIPPIESVNNSMNLDAYFSVTCNNVDFAKACSLIKHNSTSYVEAELLHQLNLSIHFHEQEIMRLCKKAQQVISKHFTQPTTIDKHAYLVNKYERRQAKQDAQRRGLQRPYVRKPYYSVSPSSQSSSSSASSPSIGWIHTISCKPLEGGFIHNYSWQPPSSEPSHQREQFFNRISPIRTQTTPTIWAKRTLNRTRLDWTVYQGGAGTRLNPIIIEDDWFRESIG